MQVKRTTDVKLDELHRHYERKQEALDHLRSHSLPLAQQSRLSKDRSRGLNPADRMWVGDRVLHNGDRSRTNTNANDVFVFVFVCKRKEGETNIVVASKGEDTSPLLSCRQCRHKRGEAEGEGEGVS